MLGPGLVHIATGLFVPKPSTNMDCQRRSMPGLRQPVRGCPLASTAVSGDCHSLCHSLVREPIVSDCCPPPLSDSGARSTPGWNKAGHFLPCGKSSATFLTCAFSSQHFSSYPASSRSDVPSLCPAITSRCDVWSMPGPRAGASSSRSQCATWPATTLTLSDLPRGVRGRPLASAGVCGGCYSFSYSPVKGRGGGGNGPRTPATPGVAMPDVVRRLVERRAAQLVVAAAAGDQDF
jgi:hypothetical protein